MKEEKGKRREDKGVMKERVDGEQENVWKQVWREEGSGRKRK